MRVLSGKGGGRRVSGPVSRAGGQTSAPRARPAPCEPALTETGAARDAGCPKGAPLSDEDEWRETERVRRIFFTHYLQLFHICRHAPCRRHRRCAMKAMPCVNELRDVYQPLVPPLLDAIAARHAAGSAGEKTRGEEGRRPDRENNNHPSGSPGQARG